MKRFAVWIPVIALLILSCATMAEKKRMEGFEDSQNAFRLALMASDFATAARFVDPSVEQREIDLEQYELIQIVEYKPVQVKVSEDLSRIDQRVMLKYFSKKINYLRTTHYQQVWLYDQTHKVWLLQTELPVLNP
jgi:hypothetical protein